MNVDVLPILKEVTPQRIYGKTVIVLDIFRCTSTIVSAMANGCTEVIPAPNPHEAMKLASKRPHGSYLLAGEIKGSKIPNFDLGNSPLEYSSSVVRNKAVILTTTNGTEAIIASKPAKQVLIGSFLNAGAVCSRAVSYQKDVVIICAGTQGNIALEDIMGAGCLISILKKSAEDIRLTDLSKTFYYLYKYFRNNLNHILLTSRSGKNLLKLGHEEDIRYCLQQNLCKIVPIYKNNSIQISHSLAIHSESN